MARKIESVMIPGPVGALEALLEEPEGRDPLEACLICHPHPLYGGTMHNKVVYRVARALRRSGSVVLRFNFRGVGMSGGEHGEGRGEVEDVRAALSWLRARYPSLNYSLAGFSFGSRIILRLGCESAGATRLLAVGFPTRAGAPDWLRACKAPKVFIQSTRDEHGPKEELEALFGTMSDPKTLIWVEAGDHFFAGALEAFEETVHELGRAVSSDA